MNISEHAEQDAELARLRRKIINQRRHLRSLNRTLRTMWEGVRFAHKCEREQRAAIDAAKETKQ